MNSFRQHFLSKSLAIIAGLAFLNMSFFLAEVSMLKFEKGQLLEIAKLLNTGFEEERDGETSGEKSVKEIDLLFQQVQIHRGSSFLISLGLNRALIDHYRHADHSLLFSPPPESV